MTDLRDKAARDALRQWKPEMLSDVETILILRAHVGALADALDAMEAERERERNEAAAMYQSWVDVCAESLPRAVHKDHTTAALIRARELLALAKDGEKWRAHECFKSVDPVLTDMANRHTAMKSENDSLRARCCCLHEPPKPSEGSRKP